MTGSRHPLLQAGLPPLRRRPCGDRAGLRRVGESYDEVSILDDRALLERYAEEIPVTLVDGKQHDFWRVDEGRLRAALASLPQVTRVTGDPDDLR